MQELLQHRAFTDLEACRAIWRFGSGPPTCSSSIRSMCALLRVQRGYIGDASISRRKVTIYFQSHFIAIILFGNDTPLSLRRVLVLKVSGFPKKSSKVHRESQTYLSSTISTRKQTFHHIYRIHHHLYFLDLSVRSCFPICLHTRKPNC